MQWAVRELHHDQLLDHNGRVISPRRIERTFWPKVIKPAHVYPEIAEIEDALDCRAELFRLLNKNPTEGAALQFLERIGAWRIQKLESTSVHVWAKGTFVDIDFGHRFALGMHVAPLTLDEIISDASHWYKILSQGESARRKVFGKPPDPAKARPYDLSMFATEANVLNTLPVSIEWHGKDPHAVIETICGWEILTAAAWADVAGGLDVQICAECHTRFTSTRKKKHCMWSCGHRAAQREYKRNHPKAGRKK